MNDGQNLAQRIYGGVIWTLSLYVESAAWVSERKDVLSTFFWMLTMWACLDYTERPSFSSDIPIMLFVGLVL